jgi:hypothetical protein
MVEAMSGNLNRALMIARTEQIRALRAGNLEQFGSSKVVSGFIRRAQRSSNVCAACLALDGTEVDSMDQGSFASHPNCRCYAQPKLTYGKTPSFPTGPEWLETQPEKVQRSILGAGKFELYKAGKLDWSKVAKVHDDSTWGPTIKQGTVASVEI